MRNEVEAAPFRDGSRPSTGMKSFDASRWWPMPPDASHVVPCYFGAGLLVQRGDSVASQTEVVSPGSHATRLLVRRKAAPGIEVTLGGRHQKIELEVGGSVLVPSTADTRWITHSEAVDQSVLIQFDPGLLDEVATEETGMAVPDLVAHVAGPDAELMRAVDALVREAERPDGPTALGWRTAMTEVILRMLRHQSSAAVTPTRGRLAPWQLRRVTRHLADRLAEDVTLAELAMLARLSPFHFCRAFAQTVGEPPHRYHQRLRLEEARRLLRTTGLPVDAVAVAVGYGNGQSLARVFRRRWGISPLEYRRAVTA